MYIYIYIALVWTSDKVIETCIWCSKIRWQMQRGAKYIHERNNFTIKTMIFELVWEYRICCKNITRWIKIWSQVTCGGKGGRPPPPTALFLCQWMIIKEGFPRREGFNWLRFYDQLGKFFHFDDCWYRLIIVSAPHVSSIKDRQVTSLQTHPLSNLFESQ